MVVVHPHNIDAQNSMVICRVAACCVFRQTGTFVISLLFMVFLFLFLAAKIATFVLLTKFFSPYRKKNVFLHPKNNIIYMSEFKIGDKVKFLNAVGGGVVKKIQGGMIYVEDDTGFDMPFSQSELIRMDDQTGVGKVFYDDTIGDRDRSGANGSKNRHPQPNDDDDGRFSFPTIDELETEVRRLRSQNANLQEQVKQLKSQILSLQRTIARIS